MSKFEKNRQQFFIYLFELKAIYLFELKSNYLFELKAVKNYPHEL